MVLDHVGRDTRQLKFKFKFKFNQAVGYRVLPATMNATEDERTLQSLKQLIWSPEVGGKVSLDHCAHSVSIH